MSAGEIMANVNILHIEDDDRQRRELTKLLHSRGFSVKPAASGKTGLEMLKKTVSM